MSLLNQQTHVCNKICVLIINFLLTRFGAYCSIFSENFFWCTKNIIYEKNAQNGKLQDVMFVVQWREKKCKLSEI